MSNQFFYANAAQLPPPPTYMPSYGAAHNLDTAHEAQFQAASPIEGIQQGLEPGLITDIIEVPDINDVVLRNFAEFDDKLKVFRPHPQLEYRWVNSDGPRYATLYQQGYRPVMSGDAARTDVKGGGPRLRAGTEKDGSRRDAILMARPKTFRERQDQDYRKLMAQNRQALDPKAYSGNTGADAGSFRGSVTIK